MCALWGTEATKQVELQSVMTPPPSATSSSSNFSQVRADRCFSCDPRMDLCFLSTVHLFWEIANPPLQTLEALTHTLVQPTSSIQTPITNPVILNQGVSQLQTQLQNHLTGIKFNSLNLKYFSISKFYYT